jgi:hypothetical protein
MVPRDQSLSSVVEVKPRGVALILSPYFPPSMLAGVHRARHLAKHLPAFGWTPIVVCVDEAYHEEQLDLDLAARVPATAEIFKVGAIPARFTRYVGVGEISLRAWGRLRRALFQVIKRRAVSVVLITGSPFYPMLFAPEIKRRLNVPVILDFQDPWVSAFGATHSLFSKAGIAHRLAVSLEPRALRGADFVTAVSGVQNAEMATRYPWFGSNRMAAIPIGCDSDDFSFAPIQPTGENVGKLDPSFVNLSYVGTFMPRSEHLVRALFRAFARLRLNEPALVARIRLNFIGTSNQPNDGRNFLVKSIAEEEGIGEAVQEIPQRIPYLRALKVLAQSDGILLIGSDEPHYTASKIYPALMSGRPYLSLFHRASSAHAILASAGGGCALAFETPEDLVSLEVALAEGLRTLALHPHALGFVDPIACARYEAKNIAGRFAAIFDSVISTHVARSQ